MRCHSKQTNAANNRCEVVEGRSNAVTCLNVPVRNQPRLHVESNRHRRPRRWPDRPRAGAPRDPGDRGVSRRGRRSAPHTAGVAGSPERREDAQREGARHHGGGHRTRGLVGSRPSARQPLPGTKKVWQGLERLHLAIQVRDAIGERKRE